MRSWHTKDGGIMSEMSLSMREPSVAPREADAVSSLSRGERRCGRDALNNTSCECVVAKANEADCLANAEVQTREKKGKIEFRVYTVYSPVYNKKTPTQILSSVFCIFVFFQSSSSSGSSLFSSSFSSSSLPSLPLLLSSLSSSSSSSSSRSRSEEEPSSKT